MVEVELSRIIINERSDEQVIVLREKEGEREFPILIGIYEATAIDRGVKEYRTPRPLTHDLICLILRTLDAQVERVIVTDLRDQTFYSKLVLRHGGETYDVDSRPSDAIALAVQLAAPIYVEEAVFEALSRAQENQAGPAEEEIAP